MAKESIKKDLKPSLKVQRDRDRELVRGVFRFAEVPGGSMSFVFKKYKEDPVERFDLVDGEIYTLPLGVAKHLNNNLWYPQHAHAVDGNGNPIAIIGKKVRRATFQSLEFTDIEELNAPADLVTVEKLGMVL